MGVTGARKVDIGKPVRHSLLPMKRTRVLPEALTFFGGETGRSSWSGRSATRSTAQDIGVAGFAAGNHLPRLRYGM